MKREYIIAIGIIAVVFVYGGIVYCVGYAAGQRITTAEQTAAFSQAYSEGYDAKAKELEDLAATAKKSTTTTTTTTPAATPKLVVVSHTGSIGDSGRYEINGEVQNNVGRKIMFAKISATFYDANKTVVDTSYTFADPKDIEAGAKSPFKIYGSSSDKSGSVASYELVTSYQ